ncbi:9203_t:CDS:1, partial [Acaulospora morrowiae]
DINQEHSFYSDNSCELCYPPEEPTATFLIFWHWLQMEFSATTYISKTQEYF